MTLKAILVGFGNIAELAHLPTYRERGIKIAAAVDICPERRRKAMEYGLDAYERLEDVEAEADFMDLCTPPNYRLEALQYASEHDLDVICEKPIAHIDDLQKTRKVLDEDSVLFFPVHNWKYAPHYRRIRDFVRDKGILEMEMNTLRTTYNHGNPDWDPDWRVKREISGGGILMDHGYHNIYIAMYLTGKNFKKVKLRDMEFFPDSNVEKKASFELSFPEQVKVNLDWGANKREVRNTIYSDGSIIHVLDDRIVVDGDEQMLGGMSRDSVHKDWYSAAFNDFLRLRKNGDNAYYREGLRVMEALAELYAQSRRIVH